MRFSSSRHHRYLSQPNLDTGGNLVIAGLDIYDTYVKAALIAVELDRLKVLSQADFPLIRSVPSGDLSVNLGAFQNTCREALNLAQAGIISRPQSVVIGLGGDFIRGVTQTTSIERPNPRLPLSESELDRLLLSNQMEALQVANAEIQREYRMDETQLQLLNSSLISIQTDGHKVLNPLNQQAMTVVLDVYSVFIPQKWLEAGQQIAEDLNLNLIALAYKPFALARGLLVGGKKQALDALVIDIGEKASDLAVIRGGILTHSRHFPVGLQNFMLALKRHLSFDASDLAALKTATGDIDLARLDKEQRQRAQKILGLTVLVWLQGLSLRLKDLKLEQLPAKIYLSGPGAGLSCIKESLLRSNWAKLVSLAGPAEIEILDLEAILGVESVLETETNFLATLVGLGCLASDILNVVQNIPQAAKGGSPLKDSSVSSQEKAEI